MKRKTRRAATRAHTNIHRLVLPIVWTCVALGTTAAIIVHAARRAEPHAVRHEIVGVPQHVADEEEAFLCVVMRTRDRADYLQTTVPHYLEEGASLVVLVDDRSVEPFVSDDPRVKVVPTTQPLMSTTNQMAGVSVAIREHMMHCTWIASVDVDELMTTRRNASATLYEELHDPRYDDIDVIQVPWCAMAHRRCRTQYAMEIHG